MYRIKKMWYIRFFVAETNKYDFQKSDTPDKNIRYIPFMFWRTSGVTKRVRMQTPLPASRCKKNLLRQVKLPDGSSKKPWIDMTSCGRILLPFVATCFGSSRSKIEKTAMPYQLTQLDPVTRHIPIHLLFFLNTAWSDLFLCLRKFTIIAF